jgi:hypothetical protein
MPDNFVCPNCQKPYVYGGGASSEPQCDCAFEDKLQPHGYTAWCQICGKEVIEDNGDFIYTCDCNKKQSLTQNVKDSNPKDSVGTKKVPFSTVSAPVIAEIGLAMLEGSRKYGRHNYRAIGVRGSVYYDACLRHLTQWWEGEDIDPDSGLSHIVKAAACLVVLRDAMLLDKVADDRPPKTKQGWVQELNKKAAEIIEKYPNALEPYTEINTKERNAQ